MTQYNSESEFHEDAERRAEAFNRRYNIRGAWTDDQLRQALKDAGYPDLDSLPDEPRGMMARHPDVRYPTSASGRHRWRRTNAAHLLGHFIMEHPEPRCDGCRDWGEDGQG